MFAVLGMFLTPIDCINRTCTLSPYTQCMNKHSCHQIKNGRTRTVNDCPDTNGTCCHIAKKNPSSNLVQELGKINQFK